MASVRCGVCGSLVKIPEKSTFTCGNTISKDSNGNYVLEMEDMDTNQNGFINTETTTEYGNTTEYGTEKNTTKENKTMSNATNPTNTSATTNSTNEASRMEALKNAGFDVSNFITQLSSMGISIDANGNLSKVTDANASTETDLSKSDDPIIQEIYANGYIKNTKTHRRFIAAQMWDALQYDGGYTAWLNDTKDYNYQFRLLIDELNVITKLKEDNEAYKERTSFFNNEVAAELCFDYIGKLRNRCKELPKHKCKGVIDYIHIGGRNIFYEDLYRELYAPATKLAKDIRKCSNDEELLRLVRKFYKVYVCHYKVSRDSKKCPAWVDAYKGSGAYYTLKNFIQYSNMTVEDYNTKQMYYGRDAVNHIKSLLDEYEGWQYLAMLKKAISYNNFDLNVVIND